MVVKKIKIGNEEFELRKFLRSWTQEDLDSFFKMMHDDVWPTILKKKEKEENDN